MTDEMIMWAIYRAVIRAYVFSREDFLSDTRVPIIESIGGEKLMLVFFSQVLPSYHLKFSN